MSNFDLHEFNILSQRHNYFMTNNRINGFPVLKESSIFLKKILAQRTSNSTGKKISLNSLFILIFLPILGLFDNLFIVFIGIL